MCHPCYRVKRVNKKLSELVNTDLFLDILHNEAQGLIKYSIVVQGTNEDVRDGQIAINYDYLRNVFDKF